MQGCSLFFHSLHTSSISLSYFIFVVLMQKFRTILVNESKFSIAIQNGTFFFDLLGLPLFWFGSAIKQTI